MNFRGGSHCGGAYNRVCPAIPFRSVNRPGTRHYDPCAQRHHILPIQLKHAGSIGRFVSRIGAIRIGFDDFRCNGLLLPASERRAVQTGLPLHRGPHRHYNSMVIDRVGMIEQGWSRYASKDPATALQDALFRLSLLQSALRTKLLDERRRIVLNRKDPLGTGFDFSELDAMAEELWKVT